MEKLALKMATVLFIGAWLFISSACTKKKDEPEGQPPLGDLSPACFQAGAKGQLLDAEANQWDGIFDINSDGNLDSWTPSWNDAHVMKLGDKYIMFVSALDGFMTSGAIPNSPEIKIYRLESSDGLSWTPNPLTPVFRRSTPASNWDGSGVETVSVVDYRGELFMFYKGYAGAYDDFTLYQIGYAKSTDLGQSWTRVGSSPLLTRTGTITDFNGSVIGEPSAVVFKDEIYLYFTAVGFHADIDDADLTPGSILQTIGLTRFNGSSWTTPELVLRPDQSVYPRALSWYGYTTPAPIVIAGVMHLFVAVANDATGWKMEKLHHASSPDGRTNWVQDSQAVFSNSSFTWTNREIRAPSPVLMGRTLRLYFGGDEAGNLTQAYGVGYADCQL